MEQTPQTLAPGMDRIIEAGETLIVTDREGQEFSVTGRESAEVMELLKAFDTWHSASKIGTVGPVVGALWNDVVRLFNSLPPRLVREMPSYKTASIGLKPHQH